MNNYDDQKKGCFHSAATFFFFFSRQMFESGETTLQLFRGILPAILKTYENQRLSNDSNQSIAQSLQSDDFPRGGFLRHLTLTLQGVLLNTPKSCKVINGERIILYSIHGPKQAHTLYNPKPFSLDVCQNYSCDICSRDPVL